MYLNHLLYMLPCNQQGGSNMKKIKKAIVVAFLLMLTFNLNLNKSNLVALGSLDEHIIDIFYLA